MSWLLGGWLRVSPYRRKSFGVEQLEQRNLCAADMHRASAVSLLRTSAPYLQAERRIVIDQAAADSLFGCGDFDRVWDDG